MKLPTFAGRTICRKREYRCSHGVVGLKTHCKLALWCAADKDGKIRRYAHLGTGNYNPSTARFYTDLSLLTSDPRSLEAVHYVFNYLRLIPSGPLPAIVRSRR